VAPSSLASAGAISLSNLSFSLAVTFVVAIPVFCLSHGFRFYGFVSDLELLASSC
jgi:hypothetical protein